MARPVLLVGSSPFDTAREAFECFGPALSGLAKRIPDGEPGPRREWISWQVRTALPAAKGLESAGEMEVTYGRSVDRHRISREGAATGVHFGPLGYAAAARESYAIFREFRTDGKIAPTTRFQVCLPTPFAVCSRIVPDDLRTIWAAYEARLFAEIDEIATFVPPEALAIQWDIAAEVTAVVERSVPELADRFPVGEQVAAIARAADRVSATAELGLHFCYGDRHHKHTIERRDTQLMVEFCNRIIPAMRRPVTWVHMPVPKARDDDDYFAPLKGLRLPPNTEFYLGLVHMTGGLDGIKRRMAAAKRVVSDFGVATECGFGRRPADTMSTLLELHRQAAAL
jgi:hypothetical protein